MRVLVSAASKHGATGEMAEWIGSALRRALVQSGDSGAEVVVRPAEQVDSLDGYDAHVLGSAVYMGHWLSPAKDLVQKHAAVLRDRPVWLFSSGPVGDPPKPDETPADVPALVEATGARGHQVFAGKLDRARLSLPERAMVKAFRAAYGDFRDSDAIEAWATSIAGVLLEPAD